MYQHSKFGLHPSVRQPPPGGIPNSAQSHLQPPTTFHGSAPLPTMYAPVQHNSGPSYLAPGPPRPSGSHQPEMLQTPLPVRSLFPTLPQDQMLCRAPAPQQGDVMRVFQQILHPAPPPPPTFSYVTSVPSGSSKESAVDNCQMSSTAPLPSSLPLLPPAPPTSSFLPLPNSNLHCLSSESNPDPDPSSSKLYGYNLGISVSVGQLVPPNQDGCSNSALNNPMVAAGSHSSADSDMEIEDDSSLPNNDQGVHQSIKDSTQIGYAGSSELDVKNILCPPESSAKPKASVMPFSEGLGEQGPELVSNHENSAFGRSISGVHSPATGSVGAVGYSLASNRDVSTAPLPDEKNSSRALLAAECINSDKYSSQVTKSDSPFKLLQDYVSDDSSENDEKPCQDDGNSKVGSLADAEDFKKDNVLNLQADTRSESPWKTLKGFGILSASSMSYGIDEFSSDSQREVKEVVASSHASRLATVHSGTTRHENQASVSCAAPLSAYKEDVSESALENITFGDKIQLNNEHKTEIQLNNEHKTANIASNVQKIDKFGRLVKKGYSDSDSDDSGSVRRHKREGESQSSSQSQGRSPTGTERSWMRRRRKRERQSRSRSWSPKSQRSRTRSPRKQRNKIRSPRSRRSKSRSPRNRRSKSRSPRSRRSRSRSPRSRRSRSRSPYFRRSGEFSSGNMRQGKGRMQECFDFLRGKCYRGAFCRYLHNVSDKGDVSGNQRRSKQRYLQLSPRSKNANTHKEISKISLKSSAHQPQIMHHEMQLGYNEPASSFYTKKDDHKREEFVTNAQQWDNSNIIRSNSSINVMAKVLETKVDQDKPEDSNTCAYENLQGAEEPHRSLIGSCFASKPAADADISKPQPEASQNVVSSFRDSAMQQLQSDLSGPILEGADQPRQQTDDSPASDLSHDKMSTTSPKKLLTSEGLPNKTGLAYNPHQLLPLFVPSSKGAYAHMTQPSNSDKLNPQTAAFQSLSTPLESLPHILPNQSSHFSEPPNSSRVFMQPPLQQSCDSGVNVGSALMGSLQFHQNHLPSVNDYRSCSTELPGHSQVYGGQHLVYPSVQESHQSHLHAEDFKLKCSPGYQSNQRFEGSSYVRDYLSQLPIQSSSAPESLTQDNNYAQPKALLQESIATQMQSFPSDTFPPWSILKSSSHIHLNSQHQQPAYGLQHPVDGVYVLPEKISSSYRYPPDILDTNQPSSLPNSGVSRSLAHYNPYASTFDKPLSSKFFSDVLCEEKGAPCSNKYDNPLSSSHALVDRQAAGSIGSRLSTSSQNSTKGLELHIPTSQGAQYDPLSDSIDPPLDPFKKLGYIDKHEPSNNSDIMLRFTSLNRPLDVEENNKNKEIGGIALATSVDNEEFGETTNAEVGNVVSGSQSSPNATRDVDMGEVEIDQTKYPGKSKKSKESRSMRLFKVCLADFVKELLKPSWRQGNISKEIFKTVVKKTVHKVSESMKGHRIPKSKAKINHYIDSSQQKLTKLVMGYVDKYTKQ